MKELLQRPTWNEFFISTILNLAKRSTCIRKKVGSILVKDTRIISIGYNGSSPSYPHCNQYFVDLYNKKYINQFSTFQKYLESDIFMDEHREFSERYELHSEQNCLSYALINGISSKDCSLYVTLSPCPSCAKLIISSKVKEVFYIEEYDRDKRGIDLLKENNITCKQIKVENV